MFWKGFVSAVGHATIAAFAAVIVAFCLLNLVMDCQSWDQPQCITVGELISGEF